MHPRFDGGPDPAAHQPHARRAGGGGGRRGAVGVGGRDAGGDARGARGDRGRPHRPRPRTVRPASIAARTACITSGISSADAHRAPPPAAAAGAAGVGLMGGRVRATIKPRVHVLQVARPEAASSPRGSPISGFAAHPTV